MYGSGESMSRKSYDEWYSIVRDIIISPEYEKRRTFRHHDDETVYEHSVKVSKQAYTIAKKLGADYRSAAIAGILHDFYTTPWQEDTTHKKFFEQHGFTHARDSLSNSRIFFSEYLNPQIENAILRHMFPLNIIPPKYFISYIVTFSDKVCSLNMLYNWNFIKKVFLSRFIKRG